MFEVADFRVQLFVFRKWQFFYVTVYYNFPIKKKNTKQSTNLMRMDTRF